MSIFDALKGNAGEFEIMRVVGAFGATSFILGANAFEAWQVIGKGQPFDLATYCVSFPTGLGLAVGAIAGAVAIKDRNVAAAKVTAASAPGPTND